MKITWLGQAGLLFETDGKRILVDPYLSDSVRAINPKNYRRVPVDESCHDSLTVLRGKLTLSTTLNGSVSWDTSTFCAK